MSPASMGLLRRPHHRRRWPIGGDPESWWSGVWSQTSCECGVEPPPAGRPLIIDRADGSLVDSRPTVRHWGAVTRRESDGSARTQCAGDAVKVHVPACHERMLGPHGAHTTSGSVGQAIERRRRLSRTGDGRRRLALMCSLRGQTLPDAALVPVDRLVSDTSTDRAGLCGRPVQQRGVPATRRLTADDR
jgi:hypothetical protein